MPTRISKRIGRQIVNLRRSDFTQNEISRDLNMRQCIVSKILRRHSQRRTVKPNASSGRLERIKKRTQHMKCAM